MGVPDPKHVEAVARWAYQFILAERWKKPDGRPRAWEMLIAESRQFWLTEAENLLTRITPVVDPILNAEVGAALFARCAACHTIWPVAPLPIELNLIAKTAKASRCPYCGGDKSFVSAHPLEMIRARPTLPTRPEGS